MNKKKLVLTILSMVLAGIPGTIYAQNNSNSLRESLLDADNGEIFLIGTPLLYRKLLILAQKHGRKNLACKIV